MKKNGFTLLEVIGSIVILGIIALLAFPPLLNMIKNSEGEIDEATKQILFSNAKDYVASNQNDFPITKGNVYCITYNELMKDTNLNLKDVSQDIKIKVTIDDNNKYVYEVDNNCVYVGPRTLTDVLKEQYNESNTVGLLKDTDNTYYYKGTNEEVANNFVWFGGHLWRVVSINSDDTLTMITQQPLTSIAFARSVWTTQAQYEESFVNHWLNNVFLGSMAGSDKLKIQSNAFKVGIYTNINEITTTQRVGLLDESQYTRAGGTDSFLDIKNFWWLGNRYSSDLSRYVNITGNIDNHYGPVHSMGVRVVIKVSDLTFTDGTGTIIDPYRKASQSTNMAQIRVGEYISIPTTGNDCGSDKRCLFRVVSKDNNSVKVILNGLLPNISEFGTSVTYASGNTVDTMLTTFANTISNTYRYMDSNKTFGIGEYAYGTDYTAAQTSTYSGNVGLPVIGEMFSGNDIDASTSSTKTFVNVATIENPTVSDYYWTMNPFGTSQVRRFFLGGYLYEGNVTEQFGVRPVLFLNSNESLSFTSGEGTAENPYMLGE